MSSTPASTDYRLTATEYELLTRAEAAERALTALRNELVKAKNVLRAYEQWEADLIMENKCWTGQNVRLTDELYERMIEIQSLRNAALAQAKP